MNTVTKDIAHQLKEAGWERETEFCWAENLMRGDADPTLIPERSRTDQGRHLPAPTATELFEELPWRIDVAHSEDLENIKHWLLLTKDGEGNYEAYYQNYEGNEVQNSFAQTPADALANLWLTLKEEGLLE